MSWFVRVFGNELRYGNSRFTDVYQQINDDISSVVMDMARVSLRLRLRKV